MIEKVQQIAGKSSASEYTPERKGPDLSPSERAEQLWGLFNEYSTLRRGLYRERLRVEKGCLSIREISQDKKDNVFREAGQNPLARRLAGEISYLWRDPQVKSIFITKLRESLSQRENHVSNLKKYRSLRGESKSLEGEYFDLLRNQFLMRQITPTLRAIDISRNRVEKETVNEAIDHLETTGGMSNKLQTERGGLDGEHADLTALLAFERIFDYHRQFKQDGIIFTPSRQELLKKVLEKTAGGTWIQLIGETGTGKTTFAKRASWILNGEPAQYASGEKWGDVKTLIGTKTMEGGKVYFDFGPLTVAFTGCQNSLEMEEAIRTGKEVSGKLMILDELNKFDQDALFGALKLAATLQPGEIFNFKELPGVKLRMARKGAVIISTMNPATVRYERKELDPALDRLFYDGKEYVDYPPMTSQSPELYEIFLSILMDDTSRIRVGKEELEPTFNEIKNTATGMIKWELDPDVKKHGALYRFALAAAEIHKSFTQKDSVAKTPTDEGFLERTVLEMEVLVKWIRGYSTQIEGGNSMATYLEKKLHDFYSMIENVNDKAIFERIFRHFGFNITNPREIPKPLYTPLTPVEIGYLTPKTPREVRRIGEEVTPRTKLYINPHSGEEITYLPVDMEIEAGKKITSGEIFTLQSKKYLYLGIDSKTKEVIFIPQQ